jgi:ribonuclease P protein component
MSIIKHTLKDRKIISRLFVKGKKVKISPLLFIFLNNENESVLFSVSKKNIPKAVDRNKIKRQMRAIFLNNKRLLSRTKTPKAMAFVYYENKVVAYPKLLTSMTTILKEIN